MKKYIVLLLLPIFSFAQFNYQALIKDTEGNPIESSVLPLNLFAFEVVNSFPTSTESNTQ